MEIMMPHTFTQIYVHLMFAVEGRRSLIHDTFRENLFRFITGIISRRNQKLIAINGMPDYVHILIGYNPVGSLSDLVRDIKAFSSKHVNDQRWVRGTFRWQEGFGAFSYSRSQISSVIRYIEDQEHHHRCRTFREEYVELLERFGVAYEQKYLFREIEVDGEDDHERQSSR